MKTTAYLKDVGRLLNGFLSGTFVLFLVGCGNGDGSVMLNREQTTALVKLLGDYEGDAQPKRIMGAMMTGKWTVRFFQDDAGVLQCKTSLQLHDEFHGWGSPTTETVGVRVFRGAEKTDCTFEVAGKTIAWHLYPPQAPISLSAGQRVSTLSLFDMESNEILLRRR